MLKTNYVNDWRLLSTLVADWPFTQEEVYKALEQEEFTGSERSYCPDPKSEILKEILESVKASIPSLFKEMCEQDQFKNDLWHLDSLEQMLNNTITTCSFVCDAPGFTTNIHIDNRMTVCSGMLFFNKADDPEQATTFYTTLDGSNPLRMSSEYKHGWYAANTSISWHNGSNNQQYNRYAIIFNNSLKLVK